MIQGISVSSGFSWGIRMSSIIIPLYSASLLTHFMQLSQIFSGSRSQRSHSPQPMQSLSYSTQGRFDANVSLPFLSFIILLSRRGGQVLKCIRPGAYIRYESRRPICFYGFTGSKRMLNTMEYQAETVLS